MWQPVPAWIESRNRPAGINIIVVQMLPEAEMPDTGSVDCSVHPGIDGSRETLRLAPLPGCPSARPAIKTWSE